MTRRSFSTRILICFLMMMFLVVAVGTGCSKSDNAPPAATTYSITGTVSGDVGANVTITLSGASSATTTTAADGTYSFTGLANGSYAVVPSLATYRFDPISTAVVVNGSNMVANFASISVPGGTSTYTISGTVSGAVAAGVTMALSDGAIGSTVTDASGEYSFPNVLNGGYTVTPSLSGYAFTPADRWVPVGGADYPNVNFIATALFTQADLVGTWSLQQLKAGTNNKWERDILTIDGTGSVSFTSCADSDGETTCPAPGTLTVTINPVGEITLTGGGSTAAHMTMAANKRFAAGTETSGGGNYCLQVLQKAAASYSGTDVQSKNFVYHQLEADGANSLWRRGIGTTSSAGAINISSETTPAGDTTPAPGDVGSTISVNSSGIVTMSGTGMATYQGFLSYDKKTIVGTFTDGTNQKMMIIQITGRTYSYDGLPANIQAMHMLAVGDAPAPFWAHWTTTTTAGTMAENNDWANSDSALAPSDTTGTITSSGVVTLTALPTYHGQVSDDGTFTVGTMTNHTTPNIYSLTISTVGGYFPIVE
ncbi:MAG: hypothetical protein CVU55_14570 [Deltaproteobacteria bacterium HGW-Deltaproteobacteria-13]|jgi:hypothetical protein|nr:MAG: hypothetical protein CVU55_14570 [Deltaproteobacteria bacterium HGW-Deltaproteobacteria-13]